MTNDPLSPARLEALTCDGCGLPFPAYENMSPGVERETHCQRCLYANNAKLTREVDRLTTQLATSERNLAAMCDAHEEAFIRGDKAEAELARVQERLASAERGCRMETVVAPDNSPVTAPCAISGCQYVELEAQLVAVQQESDSQKLRGDEHFKCQIQAEIRADRAEIQLATLKDAILPLLRIFEPSVSSAIPAVDAVITGCV